MQSVTPKTSAQQIRRNEAVKFLLNLALTSPLLRLLTKRTARMDGGLGDLQRVEPRDVLIAQDPCAFKRGLYVNGRATVAVEDL